MNKALIGIASLFLLLAGKPLSASTEVVANFRGHQVIAQLLRDRFLTAGAKPWQFSMYLSDDSGMPSDPSMGGLGSLLDLMGTLGGGPLNSRFQNGQANAVNSLLWHLVLSGVAEDLGSICDGGRKRGFNPEDLKGEVRNRVMVACPWPAPEAKTDAVLLDFWLTVMSYDAPYSEFEAWRDFVRSGALDGLHDKYAVRELAYAILFNPHFLVTK
ncbi:MAG: hypothetical protein AB7P04_14405 [Bacteriovoracia bacterium]